MGFELTMLKVISTGKCSYHTITTTTAPLVLMSGCEVSTQYNFNDTKGGRGEWVVRNRNLKNDRQYNNGRQRYKKTMVDKIQLRKIKIEQNEPH